MKISFSDSKQNKRLQKEARRILRTDVLKILGKRLSSKIKYLNIVFLYRWTKRTARDNDEIKDFQLWDNQDTVTLFLAPDWLKGDLSALRYGLRHEIVHLKDVMENNLISISKKPFKVKYRKNKNSKYRTFTKLPKNEMLMKTYNESWEAHIAYITKFFPWEEKAHNISCAYNLK